jgi:tRNA modification GTPase
MLVVANKVDELNTFSLSLPSDLQGISISAREKIGLENLNQTLYELVAQEQTSDTIISNIRHFESLQKALQTLVQVEQSMGLNLGTELIASDIREAVYHLGSITGEVTNNDLLEFIFSKFCIGK